MQNFKIKNVESLNALETLQTEISEWTKPLKEFTGMMEVHKQSLDNSGLTSQLLVMEEERNKLKKNIENLTLKFDMTICTAPNLASHALERSWSDVSEVSEALKTSFDRFNDHSDISGLASFSKPEFELERFLDIDSQSIQASQLVEIFHEPHIKQIPSRIHQDDIEEMSEVVLKKILISQKVIEPPSVFCKKTMNLKIDGENIKLTYQEKLICSFVFHNPHTKSFTSLELENALYNKDLRSNESLKKAVNRINKKVRENNFANIFTWKNECLIVNY